MDDLTALTQIRADMPPPSAETLAAARSRLVEHDVRPAVLARPFRARTARPRRERLRRRPVQHRLRRHPGS